jgi:hypothetical protein
VLDEETARTLSVSLTRERLSKYLHACRGNLVNAIALYETNSRLSAAFYIPLQSLEICLRNHLHLRLGAVYGPDWLTDPEAVPLGVHSRRMIYEAANDAGSDASGKIVAELKFAFWVGLLAPQYDATLWRRALHQAFRAQGGKARKPVHSRMNAIRRFRNRVAHHEPIFQNDLIRTHEEILEAIGWICPTTATWTRSNSAVSAVWGDRQALRNGRD